jgi:prepilin-type N-terminal cleavage/methylation domain-containing protein
MKRRGLTLFELLVVVAIVAILAAVLFPVSSEALEKARQAMCSSDMRQIGMALVMYRQDSDDQNVISNDCDFEPHWMMGQLTLAHHMRSYDIWRCPSDPDFSRTVDEQDPCRTRFFSYPYNRWTDGRVNATVDEPSKLVVFMDGGEYDGGSEGNCDWPIPEKQRDPPCTKIDPVYARAFSRHQGGYLATYYDGHAHWHRLYSLHRENIHPGSDLSRPFPWPRPTKP